MNTNQYTQKTLEALQSAQTIAAAHQNQQIEQAHLLLALLQQDGGLIPQLLKKMGVSVESLTAAAQAAVEKLPGVSGSGRDADKFYISRGMDSLMAEAERTAQGMRDEYVSVEHLFLAMLDTADETVAPLFADYRIRKEDCLKTLQAIRGSSRVTTDSPEDTYEALQKYGTDLVKNARSSAVTTRSETSSASCRASRRTTPCSSASRASARRPSPKGWRSGSSAATCRSPCRTRRSSRWTWARSSRAQSTAANLKSA